MDLLNQALNDMEVLEAVESVKPLEDSLKSSDERIEYSQRNISVEAFDGEAATLQEEERADSEKEDKKSEKIEEGDASERACQL
jgi:hypothetical protein